MSSSADRRPAPLVVLAVLATAAVLYLARELFVPVVLALLFTAVFRPVVRALARVRVPAPAAATLIVLGILGLLVAGGVLLAHPVRDWVARAPKSVAAARDKLENIRRPVRQVTQAVEQLQQGATGGGESAGGPQPAAAPAPGAGALGRVFGTTTTFLGGLLETVVLLFLLLATGDLFQRKVAAALPSPTHGRRAEVVEQMEGVTRRYLVVTALINAGQGVLVAVAMWLIGMPDPPLWGLLTFALEFLPFLGAAFMIGALAIVGFATFSGVGHALLAPGAYFAITTIQNNVVSPYAYGSGLRLNPVAVLLGVLLWYFLWGVPGAFVAVPILAAAKVIADHSEAWRRLGIVLGE
jgi:predicted PurR-regulated permease PerM